MKTFDAPPARADLYDRPLRPALLRGWQRTCPACGTGPMLRGYLTVRDACPVCHEPLHHHRADDGPAWLTVVIVGKLAVPGLMFGYVQFDPDPLVLTTVLSVGAVALALWLLPRLKGAMVALQWSRRMHGFGDDPD